MTNKIFSDIDFNFGRHPATNDLIRTYDLTAIKASMKNLVLSAFYSRPFHPEIGCHLGNLLFENNTPLTKYAIQTTVREVLLNYEGDRITIEDIFVEYVEGGNAYKVTVEIFVKGLLQSITLDLMLERAR